MRVRGDAAPSAAYTIEQQPKKPGFVLVRFFENAAPYEETADGQTVSGYEYDEYHLELADTGDMHSDVSNNFEHYIGAAKHREAAGVDDADRQMLADLTEAVEIILGVRDDEIQ